MEINYTASPTLAKFHADRGIKYRAIVGPVGSGSSTASVIELLKAALTAPPNAEGVRKTKTAIIRKTYRELLSTTKQTIWDWLPRKLWQKSTGMSWRFTHNLPDSTYVDWKVEFFSVNYPGSIDKLLSLEISNAWINEARELPHELFETLRGRLRYPGDRDDHFMILDSNACDRRHWLYKLFFDEENTSDRFQGYLQPSALSPDAENKENLPKDYYEDLADGASQQWIDTFLACKFGFIVEGEPVYPDFQDAIHVSSEAVYNPELLLTIGLDYGLSPAASFVQRDENGNYNVIGELPTFNKSAEQMAELVKRYLSERLDNHSMEQTQVFGDPAGSIRAETDKRTVFQILNNNGVPAKPCPVGNHDTVNRIGVITKLLCRLDNQS